jgi:hypothetical protein
MVVSMVKPEWIPGSYAANVSFSELHTTLECRDAKLWPIYGCIRVKPSTLNPTPWKGRAHKGFEGGQMELAFPCFGLSLESKRLTSGVYPNNTEDLIYWTIYLRHKFHPRETLYISWGLFWKLPPCIEAFHMISPISPLLNLCSASFLCQRVMYISLLKLQNPATKSEWIRTL